MNERPGISVELRHLDVEAFMREAIKEGQAGGEAGERFAIGAILVIDGRIVSRGRSRQNEGRSQLLHAELEALLKGGEELWRDHDKAVVFTTVEPCPLCLGAVVMADVPHIVYALSDPLAGAGEIVEKVGYVRKHIRTYLGGVLEDDARAMMDRFGAPAVGHNEQEETRD